MTIAFRCGECDRYYEVDDSLAGKRGKCKGCGAVFEVPIPGDVDDPYDLAAAPEPAPAERPSPDSGRQPGKTKKQGTVFAMSALSHRGFGVYIGAIVATLLAALFVQGEAKVLLAVLAGFLCMGPFLATGFAQRYGVPFRDGVVSGLMYLLIFPYRIHYRLTHREEFARVELPRFARRDLVPLALAVPCLGVLFLGAQEADAMRGAPRRNPVVAQRPAQDQPAAPRRPIEEARKKAGAPELKGPGARKVAQPDPAAPAEAAAEDRRIARSKSATPRFPTKREAAPPLSSPDERQAIDRDVRAWTEGLVSVLQSVVDVPTARDAVPRLRAIARAFDDDQARLDRLAKLPAVDDPEGRAAHVEALRAAVARYAGEAARVVAIPGVDAILTRDLLAIRPFLPGTTIRIALATPRPATPAPPVQPAAPAGVGSTVTINVGSVDGPTSKAINDALIERLKAVGNNWSLRSNTAGGRTWFTVSPVGDVQAFADGLTFASDAKVSGRTIDVVVDPTRLAIGPK